MVKVFIDGKEGTTGLKIFERFADRKDIALLELSDSLRKDINARKDMINQSDITFLCLPDDASREAITLIDNDNVKIIDASTAHRTNPDWAYGFPELSSEHRKGIESGKRISVPGCHASGFLALVYPLVKLGIMPADCPVVCHSLTGYSGGGKKMIAEYEANAKELIAPRQYALSQEHKHLKEMQGVAGLIKPPMFSPIVCNYYSGMEVTVPVYSELLNGNLGAKDIHNMLSEYYNNQKMIKIMPFSNSGMLSAASLSDSNKMEIYISGNKDRILLAALFDNLGKGASGAAVQCMNIMLGMPENYKL